MNDNEQVLLELTDREKARFWAKVQKGGPDECWPWVAGLRRGYGAFNVRRPGKHVVFRANRIAYLLTYGGIPQGQKVLHECDNPPCCNPAHLVAGTQGKNLADMHARRRHPRTAAKGASHYKAKLTEAQAVDVIRRLADGEAIVSIADDLGVDERTISDIKHVRSWKHLSRNENSAPKGAVL